MVSANVARFVVGIIGNVISVFLFLSPAPTFYGIWKKKSVEQYSPNPYLAALVNCMVWLLYGLPIIHEKSMLVVTTNGCGFAIELVYLVLFLIYSDQKKRIKVLLVVLVEVIFIAVFTTFVLALAHGHSKRSLIVGIPCIIFSVLMYASPLSVMKLVITTKSVEFMPFCLSLASFCNGVTWTAYSLIPIHSFDSNILIPNGVGTLFSIAQLILYAIYYKPTKKRIAAGQTKGNVALSEVVVDGNRADGRERHNGRASGVNNKP